METFFSFLQKRVDDCSSLVCVGLDPRAEDLTAPNAEAVRNFCLHLIRSTAPYAAAFKPNAAFFEVFGPQGWQVLRQVVECVQEESNRLGSMIPVILDAKRGDIPSTADAYAKSAFEQLGVHAITLSPYLGRDSIDPFLDYKEKGVFLLCRTSNPGAADLQDLKVDRPGESIPLYEHVAHLAQQWNKRDNIGLVVGATWPEALRRIRRAAPDLWFLSPGAGTQGGELRAALEAGLRKDGKGMLISVSRLISSADNPARAAAELRDEMISIQYSMSRGKK